MLPDGRGLGLLRDLRIKGDVTPVIILTAMDQLSDRIEGLNAGADDYLVKPFDLSELSARLNAVARRYAGNPNPLVRIGNIEIDLAARSILRAGRTIDLTAREFDVLALLAQWRGQPVSRDLLAREVWKVNRRLTPLDNVIDVHLLHLREKIDKDHPAKLIQTVRGVGFRLAEKNS